MKRLMLLAMLALAGCETAPTEEPVRATTLSGDYQAVSNCFQQGLANPAGYRKTDAPSARTSTIEGSGGGSANRIDFSDAGPGLTKVNARLATPGADAAWHEYMQILKQCSSN